MKVKEKPGAEEVVRVETMRKLINRRWKQSALFDGPQIRPSLAVYYMRVVTSQTSVKTIIKTG